MCHKLQLTEDPMTHKWHHGFLWTGVAPLSRQGSNRYFGSAMCNTGYVNSKEGEVP